MKTKFRPSGLLPVILGILLCSLLLTAANAEEPYARAALLTAKLKDGKVEAYEFFMGKTEVAGEEDAVPVILRCDANESCSVLVFAWNEADQVLPDGWQPALRKMQSFDPLSFPEKALDWKIPPGAKDISLYVAFLAEDDPALPQLEALVEAMKKEGLSDAVRSLQAAQLKRIYDSWLAGKDQSEIKSRHTKASAAVSYRAVDPESFPWRNGALKSEFLADSPGLLIFPLGKTETAKE